MKSLKKILKKSVEKVGDKNQPTIPFDLPKGFKLDRKGELILPGLPADCADLLYKTRELRLKLQRHCLVLDAAETKLETHFINTLPLSNATGISGSVAKVKIEPKAIPQVENWDAFYKYVRRTNSFALMQRRLNETAVKERWEAKKKVPGVGVFNAKKVSCTKI